MNVIKKSKNQQIPISHTSINFLVSNYAVSLHKKIKTIRENHLAKPKIINIGKLF
jgi:hypothetical protein